MNIIAIRREDKNEWERRVALTPWDAAEIIDKYDLKIIVQPSDKRIYPDEDYKKAGCQINEDISQANIIIGVKEIPESEFKNGKLYIFFSHTMKGQPYNMQMLRNMISKKISLIDYEYISDNTGKRLIFFGRYAGIAGAIETLHAYGQKLKLQGINSVLTEIKQPYQYNSLTTAFEDLSRIAKEYKNSSDWKNRSIAIGITGYGNVSQGAQEVIDIFTDRTVSPTDFYKLHSRDGDFPGISKIIFEESDMVKRKEGDFALAEYFDDPVNYESDFEKYLPHLDILINAIFWTEDYPVFVPKSYLRSEQFAALSKPQVIGDITCDIEGSVEITHKSTLPDQPNFTYFSEDDSFVDGIEGEGVTVMAVDNLPCEFSAESSADFSAVMKRIIPGLAEIKLDADFDSINLIPEMKRALVLLNGKLTPSFKYAEEYLKP